MGMVQRQALKSTIIAMLWGLALMACPEAQWSRLAPSDRCNPTRLQSLQQSPQWSQSFGQSAESIPGCLRLRWGAGSEDGRSQLVKIGPQGEVRPWAAQEKDLYFSLPQSLRQVPKTYTLFVFGDQVQSESQQRDLCEGRMRSFGYSCLSDDAQSCWFAFEWSSVGRDSCRLLHRARSGELPGEATEASKGAEGSGETSDAQAPDPPEGSQDPGAEGRGSRARLLTLARGPSRLENPLGLTWSDKGLLIADAGKHQLLRLLLPTPLALDQNIASFSGGSEGYREGSGVVAQFRQPAALARSPAGVFYVADSKEHRLRQVDASGTTSLLAGDGKPGKIDSGPSSKSRLHAPQGLAFDAEAHSLYIADTQNHCIRLLNVQNLQIGLLTIAGEGHFNAPCTQGFRDGSLSQARFDQPVGVAFDTANDILYVADKGNHAIRALSLANNTATTLAGRCTATSCQAGYADGAGTNAAFSSPHGLVFDPAGYLYVADSGNHAIRKIELATRAVTTLAGACSSSTCNSGFRDGPQGMLHLPTGLYLHQRRYLYVADSGNRAIRVASLE